jgi:hypothetical protein
MLRAFFWVMLLATVLLFGQTLAGLPGADAAAEEDIAHKLVLFMHQLLLVYWLGPDIAVMVWSRIAVKTELDVEQRIVAGKMMTMIDIVPRICLSLFLTVAGILSDTYGVTHPWWQMAGIILLGPVWLAIVLMTYLNRGSAFGEQVARYDTWLRAVLVIGIPVSVAWSLLAGRLVDTPWIAVKLIILAIVILLGMILRIRLRAFFVGVNRLATEGQSEEIDGIMKRSVGLALPLAHTTWFLLLWASLLGVVKPGESEPVDTAAVAELPAEQTWRAADHGQPVRSPWWLQ